MLESVRNNKKIAQIILGLIALTFVFFGIGDYVRNAASDATIAHIGDTKVTQQQFQAAVREQADRLRGEMGPRFDPKSLDSPAVREAILNEMVNKRLLELEASRLFLAVDNKEVEEIIRKDPALQEDGKYSVQRFRRALEASGRTYEGFVADMRQEILLRQLVGGMFGQSGIISNTASDQVLAIQGEKRHVAEFRFNAEQYLPQVKLAADAAKRYYDENSHQFENPEQLRAEYILLSQDALKAQVSPTEAEAKAWYESNRAQYVKKDKATARAKAEKLLKEVKAKPAAFAEFAKKYSRDDGSAASGGDLGFFRKEAMVKPFADAAFSMTPDAISGVVESEYGFHIIKLTDIRKDKSQEERRASHILINFEQSPKSFEEARTEIESELKEQAAVRKYSETAEAFSNMVYEQSDSLKPVADKFKLAVQQSGWVTPEPNPSNGPLANDKLLKALFSEDSIKYKRNTEAVEVAPNMLIAARVVEHKPAVLQPFESVKPMIENMLRRQEAQALAKKAGEMQLAALTKGDADKLNWPATKAVSRLEPQLIPTPAIQPVFKANTDKLPAYAGAELPGVGFALFKISKVEAGGAMEPARRDALLRQLSGMSAQQEVKTYLMALRNRFKVEVNKTALGAATDR